MHVYRYQYKNYNRSHDKRKKRRRILPVTILIVAAAVILSGGVRLDPGELGFLLQEEIVGFFLPQACGQVQGTAELTIADRLFAHFFLLPEESGVSADYQTQVESDWSYEAILAREAADENYVDAATGEVIMTQEAAEQSSTSMPEGETKEQTQGTVPEAAEGQQAEAQTEQQAEKQAAQAAEPPHRVSAAAAAAGSRSPSSTASAMAATSSGRMLEATEITPAAPSAMAGTVSSSQPVQTAKPSPQAARIRVILLPTRSDTPPCSLKVTGRSVFQRMVKQGVPNTQHSSCKPPESVSINLAPIFNRNMS